MTLRHLLLASALACGFSSPVLAQASQYPGRLLPFKKEEVLKPLFGTTAARPANRLPDGTSYFANGSRGRAWVLPYLGQGVYKFRISWALILLDKKSQVGGLFSIPPVLPIYATSEDLSASGAVVTGYKTTGAVVGTPYTAYGYSGSKMMGSLLAGFQPGQEDRLYFKPPADTTGWSAGRFGVTAPSGYAFTPVVKTVWSSNPQGFSLDPSVPASGYWYSSVQSNVSGSFVRGLCPSYTVDFEVRIDSANDFQGMRHIVASDYMVFGKTGGYEHYTVNVFDIVSFHPPGVTGEVSGPVMLMQGYKGGVPLHFEVQE